MLRWLNTVTLRLFATIVLVALGSTYGCAMRSGPQSLEGKLAQSGRQVIAAGESVLKGIDQLATDKVITPADAVRMATVIKRVGVEGERLSVVLLEVDQAKDTVSRDNAVRTAADILKVIQRLVVEAGTGIGSDAARGRVVNLLGQITDVVTNVALLFPTTATP